jgi:DNA invertase Pin-like site-specific DNA recombinase
MKVFGYARLSQESDRSLQSQRQDIERACESLGHELMQIFDEGEKSSGFSDNRPKYRRMLQLIQIEKHKVIDPDNPQDLLLENVDAFADDVKKRSEIEKSMAELRKKKQLGHPLGRPPFGLTYKTDKSGFEPATGFEKALRGCLKRVDCQPE